MSHVDGFVAPVPTACREGYRKHAENVAAVCRELGATGVVECWGDDVPVGKITSFPMALKCMAEEAVVFAWITWPSRAVRDEGWKKLMADPWMQPGTQPMPFHGKRLIYGGFEVLLQV